MKICLSNCRAMVCCNSLAFRRFSYQPRRTSSEAKFPSRRLDCIFYDPQHKLFFYTIYFQYQSLFYGTNINSVLWHKTLTDYCSATLDIVMLTSEFCNRQQLYLHRKCTKFSKIFANQTLMQLWSWSIRIDNLSKHQTNVSRPRHMFRSQYCHLQNDDETVFSFELSEWKFYKEYSSKQKFQHGER